jgi:hypothetical protein
METAPFLLATLAVALAFATWHARHVGNDRRDIALLGATTGLLGLASVASAVP